MPAVPTDRVVGCISGGRIAGGRFVQTVGAQFSSGTPGAVSLAAEFPDVGGSAVSLSIVSGTLPAGVTLDPIGKRLVYDGTAGVTAVSVMIRSTPNAPSLSFSNASGTIPVMAGIAFPKGVVTGQLGASDAGLRVVVRRTWNDGSVKHAVVCGTCDAGSRVTFNTAPIAGVVMSAANIQAAAPTAVVDLGALGSVSLALMLASPSETWIATEKMVECHYRGQFGTTDVWAEFHVRLWANGALWVRAVVENSNRIRASGTDYALTGMVTIGGTLVASYSPTALYRNTQHIHERWLGGTQYDVIPVHDVAQIQRTKLTPNYGMATSVSEAVLSAMPTSYAIGARLLYTQSMGASGYQDGIGLLPKWDACYLVSGDARAFRSVLAHGKAAFNYPILWREGSRMLVPTDHPNDNFGGPNHGGITSLGAGTLTWEEAHHPSMGYLAYLLTGDALYADALAGLNALSFQIINTDYGGAGVLRLQYSNSSRSNAWFKRTLGQAAAILPDTSVEMPVIRDWLSSHINYFASVSIEDPVSVNSEIGYPITVGTHNPAAPLTVPPWMHNFWIAAMGYISDMDALTGASLTKMLALRNWMYRGIVGALGNGTGYCYAYASKYDFVLSSDIVPNYVVRVPSQNYMTWAEVMTATNGAQSCGTAMLGTDSEAPSNAYFGYWGNILPAISYAVDHGAAGAAEAYARMTSATNWSSIVNSAWSSIPLWGCAPRQALNVSTRGCSIAVAATSAFLSGESVAGTYNAGTYLWTPGRGSDGRVTQESFDLVPTDGTWVEVAGTKFYDSIQPLLASALPGYNDPGSNDVIDTIDDYNGFAHDAAGGRIFAHGGGHQGSANNGIYRCDLAKMTWVIAKLPDMQTYWPANYKTNPPRDNSYTIYTNAKDYCVANPTTGDIYHDEFYDPVDSRASTRNPTARHTYFAMTYYGGKLRHGVRRYWEWDEESGAWSRQYPLGKNYTTHSQAGGGQTGEAVKGTFDEVRNRYICTPTQISSVPNFGWAYNIDTNTFSQPSNLIGGWEAYVARFARRGREWCSFARPTLQGDYWPPSLKVWNLDTEVRTTVNLTGLDQTKCISNQQFDEATFIEYVPAIGKFFVMMPYDLNDAYASGVSLPLVPFLIDTAAGTITHETQAGAFPALTSTSLIKNKLVYVPQLKCLILVHSATVNMRIRRFP